MSGGLGPGTGQFPGLTHFRRLGKSVSKFRSFFVLGSISFHFFVRQPTPGTWPVSGRNGTSKLGGTPAGKKNLLSWASVLVVSPTPQTVETKRTLLRDGGEGALHNNSETCDIIFSVLCKKKCLFWATNFY